VDKASDVVGSAMGSRELLSNLCTCRHD